MNQQLSDCIAKLQKDEILEQLIRLQLTNYIDADRRHTEEEDYGVYFETQNHGHRAKD